MFVSFFKLIFVTECVAGEKKARTFDLTAMLEQAKQTARARSQKTFGKSSIFFYFREVTPNVPDPSYSKKSSTDIVYNYVFI